jgi:hypothetical protein
MAEMEDDQLSVVRHHNRVLRTVHKTLRNALKLQQEKADSNFIEICETKTEAELAIEELWMRGELDCSPQDYQTIIELAVAALQQQRRGISTQGLENIIY